MDIDELKKLIEFLRDTDVTDIQIEQEGMKVRLKREKFMGAFEPAVITGTSGKARVEPPEENLQQLITVTAPLVGTFYRSASPDAQPYVEEGGRVRKGQVLCLVEAMKLMNEIESEVDGVVIRVLVENAQPVEYSEPLFLIDPA
jgi:acetyl-CoA carboxylase biotin carboxyl carrier protein